MHSICNASDDRMVHFEASRFCHLTLAHTRINILDEPGAEQHTVSMAMYICTRFGILEKYIIATCIYIPSRNEGKESAANIR